MKSLQNQYNLIKEGKGNKELFLKEAKTLFPNVVTNALTFDQAIHNLSERGIISEALVFGGVAQNKTPDWFKIFKENVKADLKETDKEVEEMETKGYDYKEKNNNNISTAEMLKGYYTEMKDPKNAEKTEDEIKAIVVKNLEKDPLYYVKDGQFGVKGLGYTEEAPGLGQPKEATGKYKSSGMEPVKLNESKHSDEADLKIYKSELNMLNKIKATGEKHEKRKAELEKKIADLEKKMTEVFYGGSDGDFDADQEDIQMAYYNYDKGLEAYSEGDFLKADKYYTAALRYGSYVGWTEQDLPPYEKATKGSLGEYDQNWDGSLDDLQDMEDQPMDAHDTKAMEMFGKPFDELDEYEKDRVHAELDHDSNPDYFQEGLQLTEAKRKAVEKHLKEIEKLGELAAVSHKIEKIDEKINELTTKLSMTEGDDVKDMVDKKAVKEIQKDIKLYEKKKAFYEKMHSKMSKKVEGKPATEEAPIVEVEAEEEKPKFHDPEGDMIRQAMKRDVTTKLRPWSEIVKDILKNKVPGQSK